MIPGIDNSFLPSTDWYYRVETSEQNLDLFARVGSPSVAITLNVVVISGVRLSSSAASGYSLILDGFAADTTINLTVDSGGEIFGAGGDGGQGSKGAAFQPGGWGFYGGGGGGGWGDTPGSGGTGFVSTGFQGVDGIDAITAVTGSGGGGGLSDSGSFLELFDQIYQGENGGSCISLNGYSGGDNITLNITNNGKIYRGGGGGHGGYWDDVNQTTNGSDGGGAGQKGEIIYTTIGHPSRPNASNAGRLVDDSLEGTTVNWLTTGDVL